MVLQLQLVVLLSCASILLCDALLDCSAFTANSSNATIASMSWAGRLSACFAANSYDTSQPPLLSSGATFVNVSYDYSVVYIISLEQGVISFLGQLTASWPDMYRQWNYSQIPISQILVPLSDIWRPQFLYLSTIEKKSLKLLEPDDMAVLFTDKVVLIRRNVLQGHCNTDYNNFPFDSQTCTLEFLIDRFFFYEMDLGLSRLNYTYRLETFTNDEWTLSGVSHAPMNISFTQIDTYPNGSASDTVSLVVPQAQTGFKVKITLTRHPEFYVANVLTPVCVLTVVGQTVFAIPERADSKLLVPLTVLLGFMFVQGIVANEMPPTEQMPYVAIYIVCCILLSGLSCIMCALVMWVAHIEKPLPLWLKRFCLDWVGFILFPNRWCQLCVRSCKSREETQTETLNAIGDASSSDDSNKKQKAAHEKNGWLQVAEVINRLFAIVHILAIIGLFASIIIPLLF